MKIRFLFLIIITTISFSAIASDSTRIKKIRYHKSLRIFYQAGSVLQTNHFLQGKNAKGLPVDYFQSYSLQYGISTDGRKLWQQIYGYPVIGFGIYSVTFFNDAELGTPTAVYSFINAPIIKRYKKWSINYEVGFGLAYNWKPYNPITNQYQLAIGSNKTVFLDAGLNVTILFGRHLDFSAGFTFTHFSNGAMRIPNFGINMRAPRIGLKYSFRGRPEFTKQEIPKFIKKWEWIILGAISVKQLAFLRTSDENDSSYLTETYKIVTMSTGINRQISHKVKFGFGMDFSYDDSYNSYVKYDSSGSFKKTDAGTGNKFTIGLHCSFELVISRLSLIIQPGWYVYRDKWDVPESPVLPSEQHPVGIAIPKRRSGNSYQRIGLKYHIFKNIFAGINVRAYDFSIADYIEWNIGYRIKWQKSYRK